MKVTPNCDAKSRQAASRCKWQLHQVMRLKTCRKLSYQKICRKLLASAGRKIITKSSSRKPLQLHSSSHLACHALNQSHNCPRVPLQSQSPVQSHISLRKYVRPLGQQQRRECVHSRRVIPADPVCGPLRHAPLAICNCLRSLVCHLCRSTSCHELAENSTIFLSRLSRKLWQSLK